MSPEQARGLRTLGPPSDVFNLGLILYECATGYPAFKARTSRRCSSTSCCKIRSSSRCAVRKATPELDALLARWLSKNPNERPQNGTEAAAELAAPGPLPEGPRRDAHHLLDGKTRAHGEAPPPSLDSHCLVLASRGFLDDYLDPPTTEELSIVEVATIAAGGQLEVLATGTLATHFSDAADEGTAALRPTASALFESRVVTNGRPISLL